MSGGRGGDHIVDDLRRLGATEEQIAQAVAERQAEAPPEFEVLADNWLAVLVFLDLGGQWQRNPDHTPIAIDRSAIHACFALWPVPSKKRADTFHRIRVLEAAAAAEFKRRAKSG